MVESLWLGPTDYATGLELQRDCFSRVENGAQGFVLGLEHPSVITLGKRGDRNLDVVNDSEIQIFNIDRGGQATLHTLGQLVIYPIMPVGRWGLGPREFVELLQQTTMEVLGDLGVPTFLKQSPGIYTDKGKIAFVGIRIENKISRHGISINVSNDLKQFQCIRSCGVVSDQFDRLMDYDSRLSPQIIYKLWADRFTKKSLNLIAPFSSMHSNSSQMSSLGVVGSAFP